MEFVPNAVALSLTRELGPLMTAIIVIGRSGSAFAAEIGTMKVSEEIDALETMALDPIRFLVAPKLVAMLIMMPCLTMWSDFMGIAGGAVFGILGAGFTITSYFRATLDSLLKEDIITGLIKSVHVWHGDYCGGLPGRIDDRPGLRASGPFDYLGGGEIDFRGHLG